MPLLSVTELRTNPLAESVAVTDAPGITAPVESFTTPFNWAVEILCAKAVNGTETAATASSTGTLPNHKTMQHRGFSSADALDPPMPADATPGRTIRSQPQTIN